MGVIPEFLLLGTAFRTITPRTYVPTKASQRLLNSFRCLLPENSALVQL